MRYMERKFLRQRRLEKALISFWKNGLTRDRFLTVMPQIVWQWRLFNVYMDCWKMNW